LKYRELVLTIPKPLYEAIESAMDEARKYGVWRQGDRRDLFVLYAATLGLDEITQRVLQAKAPSLILPS